MRDPSHTHALTTMEFDDLFKSSMLLNCLKSRYEVTIELEAQLSASFPKDGDEFKIREMITNDIGVNNLDINAHRKGNQIFLQSTHICVCRNKTIMKHFIYGNSYCHN